MSREVAKRGNGAGRGGPARGYSWPPFERGNTAAVTHSAYATAALGPRVDELADVHRPLVPGYSPSDEPAVRLLALAFARLERAEVALEAAGPDEMRRLRQDALGWANAARRLLNDLGMTPTARSRLGLTLARGESVVVQLQRESRDREQEVEA
jgi:hypothetical protein